MGENYNSFKSAGIWGVKEFDEFMGIMDYEIIPTDYCEKTLRETYLQFDLMQIIAVNTLFGDLYLTKRLK